MRIKVCGRSQRCWKRLWQHSQRVCRPLWPGVAPLDIWLMQFIDEISVGWWKSHFNHAVWALKISFSAYPTNKRRNTYCLGLHRYNWFFPFIFISLLRQPLILFFLLTSFQKRNRIIITAARLCLKTQNKPSFTQNDCLAEQVYYAVTLSDCTYLIVSVNCFLHVQTLSVEKDSWQTLLFYAWKTIVLNNSWVYCFSPESVAACSELSRQILIVLPPQTYRENTKRFDLNGAIFLPSKHLNFFLKHFSRRGLQDSWKFTSHQFPQEAPLFHSFSFTAVHTS